MAKLRWPPKSLLVGILYIYTLNIRYLKYIVYYSLPKTLADLKMNLEREIKKFQKIFLKILKKICKKVISVDGGHIKYKKSFLK